MGEVDAPTITHNPRAALLLYLRQNQAALQPQFSAPQIGWQVAGKTGTRGLITGFGQYQDSSTNRTSFKDVEYSFIFERPTINDAWLLKRAFAVLL
jgi:hypothetical protein